MNVDDSVTTSQPKTTLSTTLTNVQLQNSPRLAPSKKLLSTPTLVRQKVSTFQQRQTIQRPALAKPVPTAIIHKVSSNRNKSAISRSFHEPGLTTVKRSAPISTYRPANVARRIGNTTIYKTEKSPPVPTVKRLPPTPFKSPIQRTMKPTTVSSIQTQPTSKAVAASVSPTVINMPLLTPDDETSAIAGRSTDTTITEVPTLTSLATDTEVSELSTLNLSDSETPLLITGDDGTIYQVAGQNEEGQTILISEGPDGQQQCVIVSSEVSSDEIPAVMQDTAPEPEQMEVDQPLSINTQSEVEDESGESEESHVVAQIIKADPPSPGMYFSFTFTAVLLLGWLNDSRGIR
ncbi:uncharacterized protein LOC116182072 [Photinus pyralis]|uniref:uncharacterized protein LOC116182072 n=1 Tax=Photinus pyralis TaxID=7054 RepID=UPI00126778FF|nr:uncharacterized protein LOC116182072 [Photinus pyralis]